MIKIVVWKWKRQNEQFRYREEYTAKHVNIFANMVSRNLNVPYEIVCVTDDPTGIDSSIRTVPIWNDFAKYGMCYRRLRIFSKEMKQIIGPKFITMDLDCIITNDITSIVNFNEPFKIWRPGKGRKSYCGSMFGMQAGTKDRIWKEFNEKDLIWLDGKDKKRRKGKMKRWAHKHAYDAGFTTGSDQAYISWQMWPNAPTWSENDGVISFKRLFKKDIKEQERVVKKAKIIFFPGGHDPSHENLYRDHPWIPKYYIR